MSSLEEFMLDVLRTFHYGESDSLWWRTDNNYAPVTFFINCNDMFAPAADCEKLTPENLPVLKQAMADCDAILPGYGEIYGCDLFCCRVRGMRPQIPVRSEIEHLFFEVGPERN